MFQLIGGSLAALAVILAVTGSLFAGCLLALLTLLWVTVARPVPASARRAVPVHRTSSPWASVYGQPAVR